ncbi:MAG: InlB B-repeat-containing protein, partial [Endomicrobiaceae bacterium]
MTKLTSETTSLYSVMASNNDGMSDTQNGFIHSHTIIFKVYKSATNTEYTFSANEVTHISGNQNFAVLGIATFNLNGSYSQDDVFSLTLTADPVTGGTLQNSANYISGKPVTINAVSNIGYVFQNWQDNGITISTEAMHQITMPEENYFYTANFTAAAHQVTVSPDNIQHGSTSGGGTYGVGALVSVVATAQQGYAFSYWTRNGQVASINAQYNFIMPNQAQLLVAYFEIDTPVLYNLTANVNPVGGGIVDGLGQYPAGQTVTVTATPAVGYSFVNWTRQGVSMSINPNYTFNMPASDVELVANFQSTAPDEYNLNLSVSPDNSGNVSGAGSFPAGQAVTVTATANTNYSFVNWTKNGQVVSSIPNYTFNMPTENISLVANFSQNIRTLTLSVSPANSGVVSGTGNYNAGDPVTVTATANTGYTFLNWTNGGNIVSESSVYTFNMPDSNINLTANFSANQSQVSLAVNPVNSGTVTGAGTYSYGASVTVTATANSNYIFENWTKDNQIVSSNSNYTFNMPAENINLIANFEELAPTLYTVTAVVNPEDSGTITGAGQYEAGQSVTLTVTPSENYNLLNWTKDDQIVSSNPSYTFDMPANNVSLQANLSLSEYSLMLEISPVGAGTVSGTGTYNPGEQIELSATANPGYQFLNWKQEDNILSTNQNFVYTMPAENVSLTAQFTAIEYNLNIIAEPVDGGIFTGQGTYTVNDPVSLNAVPNTGYQFDGWKINDQLISTNPQYTYTMPANNVNITAHFSLQSYSLTLITSPADSGQLSGSGQYTMGSEISISVEANPGFEFVNWKNGNTEISTTAEFVFIMPAENVNLTAFLSALNYDLSLSTIPENAGTTTGQGSYIAGAEINISVNPAPGYSFNSWIYGEMLISNQPDFVFIMPVGDTNLTANFDIINYDLDININPINGGTVTGIGSYPGGTSVPLSATPALGYQFVNWKNGDTILSTSENYSFSMLYSDVTLSANFETILYPLTISVNPTGGGIVSGAGSYTGGSQVQLTAVAAINHSFSNWSLNGEIISNSANYLYTMPYQEANLTANFSVDEFTLILDSNPQEGGIVTGAGTYAVGEVVNISAQPNEGYRFTQWKRQGVNISNSADYNFFMPAENQTIIAHFELIPPSLYALNLNVMPAEGGNVTGAGTYAEGEEITVIAVNHPDYRFINWTSNNQIVSENIEYTFNMPANNLILNANFALKQYVVNIQRNPANGGTVTGAGTYISGRNVVLQASPATNYQFINWTNTHGDIIETQETLSFVMPEEDVHYIANFSPQQYNVNAVINPQNGGTVTGTGSYSVGAEVSLTATPAENYHFISWTNVAGTVISNNNNFTFFM